MIPKIIHYCWLSGEPIPEKLQQNVDSWKKLLPDYEFVKWDFSRFDKHSSVWVSQAFDAKKYAFACDYIRLYAVYQFGGFYLDMDVQLLRRPDDLLQQPIAMATERPDKCWIEAGAFGAEKGQPFLAKCLEYYQDKPFIKPNGSYSDLPQPVILSRIYQENRFHFPLADWMTFTCKSYDTGVIRTGEHSYCIHHFAASWKSPQERRVLQLGAWLRNRLPVLGKPAAFVVQKGYKGWLTLKTNGVKGLAYRVKQFFDNEE